MIVQVTAMTPDGVGYLFYTRVTKQQLGNKSLNIGWAIDPLVNTCTYDYESAVDFLYLDELGLIKGSKKRGYKGKYLELTSNTIGELP